MKIGEIEKGIEPPLKFRGRYTDQLGMMEVGDSFLIWVEKGDNLYKLQNTLCASMSRYGKQRQKKFSYRTIIDESGAGVRIWRIV